jgi:two-component system sensor histidine kinase BaeS
MRTRITAAIVGSVLAALVLTGLGTLVLDRLGARSATESELRDQAEGLATLIAPTVDRQAGVRRPALARVLRAFELEGIDFVFLDRQGRIQGRAPRGIGADHFDPDRLLAGETLSGHDGRTVYALAPAPVGRGALVAVLTRSVDLAPGRAFRWFVLSAALTLVAGAVVAVLVSRALTGRLRAAEAATHRIATGDLSTRLAAPPEGARDELSDLTRSINTMAEGLERSRGLEQQFLLSVSHDLRTPLTSIRGYAEAIGDGRVEPVPAAGVILSEAQRLERLVADLPTWLASTPVGSASTCAPPTSVASSPRRWRASHRRRSGPASCSTSRRAARVRMRSSTPIGSARWSRTCSTTGAGTRSAGCG